MGSNATVNSTKPGLPSECSSLGMFAWKEEYLTPTTFTMYIVAVSLEVLVCPFTILLNVLVILAVKRKRYLRKQKPCVLLACLAATDLLVGAVVLPLVITSHILRLVGNAPVCVADKLATETVYTACGASLFHLVIISGERYVAIKHALRYETLVTTRRLAVAVAVAWAIPVVSSLGSSTLDLVGESVLRNHVIDTISSSVMLSVVLVVSISQISLFVESRRHRKHIRAHQVSEAAAKEILKQDKAARTTTMIVGALCLCYAPQIIQNVVVFSMKSLSKSLVLGWMYVIEVFVYFNSLINPVIYCVRSEGFKRAFSEFLNLKTTQANLEIDRRNDQRSRMRQQDSAAPVDPPDQEKNKE